MYSNNILNVQASTTILNAHTKKVWILIVCTMYIYIYIYQLQQQLEYTLLKPDCHCWWISKMQSYSLEERYAIKLCFKLGRNDATETYGMLQTAFRPSCMNRESVFEWHKKFKEGGEYLRDDERCERSKEVNAPELIGQKVRVRVTMVRF